MATIKFLIYKANKAKTPTFIRNSEERQILRYSKRRNTLQKMEMPQITIGTGSEKAIKLLKGVLVRNVIKEIRDKSETSI